MAEQQRQRQQQQGDQKGPSSSHVLAVVTLLPLGGLLLFIAGLTLAGTVLGLAVTTPLFVIFSPVLVPAAFVIGLALFGFLASGAFGVTAISSFSWMATNMRQMMRGDSLQQQMELSKLRAEETASQMGKRAREMADATKSKGQEVTKVQSRGQEAGKS